MVPSVSQGKQDLVVLSSTCWALCSVLSRYVLIQCPLPPISQIMAVISPVSCTAGRLEAWRSVVSMQESQDPPVRTPVTLALGPLITVKPLCSQGLVPWGAWLALSVDHATPDPRGHEFKPHDGRGAYFQHKHIQDLSSVMLVSHGDHFPFRVFFPGTTLAPRGTHWEASTAACLPDIQTKPCHHHFKYEDSLCLPVSGTGGSPQSSAAVP